MEKMKIKNLSVSDLLKWPVWRYWTTGEMEFVQSETIQEITEISDNCYIVLTEFILNNKIKFIGFCSPQDFSGLDYIQPVILTKVGQVNLYKELAFDEDDKLKDITKLGYTFEEVFPIYFHVKISCDGEFRSGKVADFNEFVNCT